MSTLYENHSRSVSSFIHWAHQRIEKEIEINEECERQFGSAEVIKDTHKLHNGLSNQEKLDLVYEVNRLSEMYPNLIKAEICSMAGLHFTTFYKWKKQLTKKGLL
jgi:hypothetical protein